MHQTCTGKKNKQELWVHPSVVARLFVFFVFLVLSSKHEGSKFAFGLGFRALKCIKQHKTTVFTVFSGVLLSKISAPTVHETVPFWSVVEPSPSASPFLASLGFLRRDAQRTLQTFVGSIELVDRVGHELVIVPELPGKSMTKAARRRVWRLGPR